MDERPDVATRAELAELDLQVERGSLFTQAVLQRTSLRISEAEVVVSRLIEVLATRGVVDPAEFGLEREQEDVIAPDAPATIDPPGSPLETSTITWPTIAIREDPPATVEARHDVEVDCAARLPVCHAVCCRLKFPLSAAEVDAGRVKWDIGHPYIIRHGSDGRCVHHSASGGCSIYDDRPRVCRTYSCANDPRIWSDFEGMVLNQAWIDEHLVARDGIFLAAAPPQMAVPVELTTKEHALASRPG